MAVARVHLQKLFEPGNKFTPTNLLEKDWSQSPLSIMDLMKKNAEQIPHSDDVSSLQLLTQTMKLAHTRSTEKTIISFYKFNVASILRGMVMMFERPGLVLHGGTVSKEDLEMAFRMCNSFFSEEDYDKLAL